MYYVLKHVKHETPQHTVHIVILVVLWDGLKPTWTKQHRLHLPDHRVHGDVIDAPAEHLVPGGQRGAGTEGAELPPLQARAPHVQVRHVPKEGLGEVPPEGVLVLAQDEDALPVDVPGRVGPLPGVPRLPVHVDGPAPVAPPPRHAQVVPEAVVGEGGLVGPVLAVDDQSQQDATLAVPLAAQLELVGEDGSGVGEDGGHLVPGGVPLDAHAHAHRRQRGEGGVDPDEALPRGSGEVESAELEV